MSPGEVRRARMEEISYIDKMNVWMKITRAEAISKGWKVIATRWIDVNKGDMNNPLYRSRLVGKEFNDGYGEGLFASTPPLEALKFLISDAATVQRESSEEKVIMINDVSRAFFEAMMHRKLCVELPNEAKSDKD